MEKRKYQKVNFHNEKWTRSSFLGPARPFTGPADPQLQARLPLGRSTAPSTEPFRVGHGGPTLRSMGGANAAGGAVCLEQK